MSAFQLFHTVKYLKPGQVINRLVRRVRKLKVYEGDALPSVSPKSPWRVHAALRPCVDEAGSLRFLNESGPPFQWEDRYKSKLWLYNLHYFDDLVAQGASERTAEHREVISRWMAENPPLTGTGWEPYPLSLRICNWIKWLLLGNEALEGMEASLVQQADALNQQVEYHLLGNHILANAKALVFAGVYFDGELAEQWLQLGLDLLSEQLAEQILADGAHFELSPMYHSIILVDVLDILQLAQCYPGGALGGVQSQLCDTAVVMANWLEGMLHPDGEISFFNDAAFGIAPSPNAILDYVHELGIERPLDDGVLHYYKASGYISVRQQEHVLLMDVAAIGPDYIPGHAHADTLSFEWSWHGQRVLVNSGISEYGLSEERLRQRGTAAHNTVVVNGESSSEVWSGFRVARRARPIDIEVGQEGDCVSVRASHDGYRRLRPKVTHTREWRVEPGSMEITDTLAGEFTTAVAYFHFHPSVTVVRMGDCLYITLPDGQRCEMFTEDGSVDLEEGTWHPEFGIREKNWRAAITFWGPVLKTTFQ